MLTDKEIKNAKPREKAYRLFDGAGLYLEISPAGGKLWRWKYRYQGKEKRLSFGAYPEVRAPDARKLVTDARDVLKVGTDPGAAKKARKEKERFASDDSFEAIGRQWYAKTAPSLAVSTKATLLRRLENDVFPWIGPRPIAELAAPDLLGVIRRIEGRGGD